MIEINYTKQIETDRYVYLRHVKPNDVCKYTPTWSGTDLLAEKWCCGYMKVWYMYVIPSGCIPGKHFQFMRIALIGIRE